MLFIAAAQWFLLLLFVGIGLLAPWNRFRHEPSFNGLLAAFWTGWALALGALQIWHLLFPIGAAAFWLAVLAGLMGWLRARRSVLAYLRGLRPASALALAGLAVVPALALASHVFFVPPHYDHGLYHQQTVMWLNEYAIVPGLGNLHHRLAFNNANFLYAALLNAAPTGERAFFLANTTLALAVILRCAAGLFQLFNGSTDRADAPALKATPLYYALMLPAVLWHYSTTHLPGYSPDVVVFSLQVVLGGALLGLFERNSAQQPSGDLLGIVLLAAVGTAVKLSFGVFGGLAVLAALIYWFIRHRPREWNAWISLAAPVGLGALLIIPWLARGVLLSGYPLFPSPALGFPTAWRMPRELVEPVSPIILNWARTANDTIPYTGDLAWLRQWYAAFPFDVVKRAFLLAVAAAGIGLAWLAVRSAVARAANRSHVAAQAAPILALLLIAGLSVAAWFVLAPDYRFSGALIWMLLAAALMLLANLAVESGITRGPLGLAVGMVLGLTILISPNHFEVHKPGQQLVYPVTETEWVRQFSPELTSETRATASGLEITLPPEPLEQCFGLPLPCTRPQDFLSALRLIEPGELQRGFTLEP